MNGMPLALAVLVLLPLAGWSQQPRSDAAPRRADARFAARVAGCYALEPGPWQRDAFLGRPYPDGAPTQFRLGAERFVAADAREAALAPRGAFRAAVVPGPAPDPDYVGERASPNWRWDYWGRVPGPGDTLRVTRLQAFGGVDLVLAPAARGLAGRIEVWTDVRHPGQPYRVSRPVRAWRVPCTPEPARAGSGAGAV